MATRPPGRPIAVLALMGGLGLGGCVDPAKRFDDFDRRVIDADVSGVQCEGARRDVTGEFLTTISPGFSPDSLLQFIGTVDMAIEGDAATASFSFQPLRTATCDPPAGQERQPIGDPLEVDDVDIDGNGAFTFTFEGAIVPGEANSVSCSGILADITLSGIIQSPDLWCGDASGMVMQPTPANLEGSTFGAVRVDPGTLGDELPEPLPACPPCGDDLPDGG
jgi:hypothetical protein